MMDRFLHCAAFGISYLFLITAAYSSSELDTPKPIVIYLNRGSRPGISVFDDLRDVDEGYDGRQDDYRDEYVESHDILHNDDNAYFLYHLLRNVIDDDDASTSLEDNLAPTKQILRSALRARCGKVDKCVQKCPPKKPSCPKNCQQDFDNLNLCPPPKKKPSCNKKPKCGKTLPPRWL